MLYYKSEMTTLNQLTDQWLTVRETTSSHKNTEGLSHRPGLLGTVAGVATVCKNAHSDSSWIHSPSHKTEGRSAAKWHCMATCVDYLLLPINGRLVNFGSMAPEGDGKKKACQVLWYKVPQQIHSQHVKEMPGPSGIQAPVQNKTCDRIFDWGLYVIERFC